jgi:small conductance mechanosensitive channel
MAEQVIAEGLTVLDWVRAGAVFVAGVLLGRGGRWLLVRRVSRDDSEARAAVMVVGRLMGSVAMLGGLIYALTILEVRIGPLLGAIGIGGIALALAAQSLLANFFASIILQSRRPFRRGDEILTGDQEGRVEDVDFRTVILRSYDGQRVFVPCTAVLDSPIVNYTALGRRRSTLRVGVAFDSELPAVQQALVEAVASVPGVYHSPPSEALIEQFGESSIDFAVRYWHAPDIVTTWQVRSAVAMAVKAGLDKEGVTIPFPHRTLQFRSVNDGDDHERDDATSP